MIQSFVLEQAMAKVSYLRLLLSLVVPESLYSLLVHSRSLNVIRYVFEQAIEKGINTIVINKDMTRLSALWSQIMQVENRSSICLRK